MSEGLAAADDKVSFPMYRGCCEHVLEHVPLVSLRIAGQGVVIPAPARARLARVLDKAIVPAVVILRTRAMSEIELPAASEVLLLLYLVRCSYVLVEFHKYPFALWRKLRFIQLTCSDSTRDSTRPRITHHTTDQTL